MNAAFVSIGGMSLGMPRRVPNAERELDVFIGTKPIAQTLDVTSLEVVDSSNDVFHDAPIALAMLGHDLAAVSKKASEILESMPSGSTQIAIDKLGSATIRELDRPYQAANQAPIAAPAVGRIDFAAAGQLVILAAGESEAFCRHRPVFAAIGCYLIEGRSDSVAAAATTPVNNLARDRAIEAHVRFASTRRVA